MPARSSGSSWLQNPLAEGARDQLDREVGSGVTEIQDRIQLDALEADQPPGIGKELEEEVRLPVADSARLGRAGAGRDLRIETVEIERKMDAGGAVGGGGDRPLGHGPHPQAIDLLHGVDLDARALDELPLPGIQTPRSDQHAVPRIHLWRKAG